MTHDRGSRFAGPACPACGAGSSPSLVKDGCRYFECSACELLFHRITAEGGLAGRSSYDGGYWESEHKEAMRREVDDAFLRALELLGLSSIRVANLLDFGCGLGLTVQLLRDRLGINAVGVDISGEFVESEYLHRCTLDELSGKYPPGYFDAILSVEVFEHLEDPKSVLSALNRLLKQDGKILINTGTREYLKDSDPEMHYLDPLQRGHITIFSLKSFQQMAAGLGLTAEFMGARKYAVIISSIAGLGRPHPENLERMRSIGEWGPALLREYLRLIYLEREFEERSVWALQLAKMVDQLSPGARQTLSRRPLLRKAWQRLTRR